MNIFDDIAGIVKNDFEHNVRVEISYWGIAVYLYYDPKDEWDESCYIPIEYDCLEDFAYIPQHKFIDSFKVADYGLDSNEISLIKKIMTYFEGNKEDIQDMCDKFSAGARHKTIQDVKGIEV